MVQLLAYLIYQELNWNGGNRVTYLNTPTINSCMASFVGHTYGIEGRHRQRKK